MANEARFIGADRAQARWDFIDLEGFLPSDHRARIVVCFVESLDLAEMMMIKSVRPDWRFERARAEPSAN